MLMYRNGTVVVGAPGLTSTSAMPAKRMDHAATPIKDRYLLIHGGGGADGTVYNTIHLLDLGTREGGA